MEELTDVLILNIVNEDSNITYAVYEDIQDIESLQAIAKSEWVAYDGNYGAEHVMPDELIHFLETNEVSSSRFPHEAYLKAASPQVLVVYL